MKRFKFRLEKVLEHKMRLFDLAEEEYMIELRVLHGEEEKLEKIKADYRHSMQILVERTKQKFTIKELAVHYKYLFHLKREMKSQVDVVVKQEKVVEAKRVRLIEASKEKEVLVRLKDKKYKSYIYDADKDEQKMMDDITNAKYIQHQNV
jgi:flagellar FliJ protein